jgi:hypothetical protein
MEISANINILIMFVIIFSSKESEKLHVSNVSNVSKNKRKKKPYVCFIFGSINVLIMLSCSL